MHETERAIPCPACDAVNTLAPDDDAMAFACRACGSALFNGQPLELTTERFNAHALAKGLPIVIDFWAAWCGPCQTMAPIFLRLLGEFEPRARFAKVDTDAEAGLAQYFRIQSIPTLSIIRDQREIGRTAGLRTTTELRDWITRILATP